MSSIIADALAYAAYLDSLLASDMTDEMEHALVFQVGDLLGGLGVGHFTADLKSHLASIEDREYKDHPGAWSAGLGGNDPDAYVSDWLTDRINDETKAAAEVWLTQARAIVDAVAPMSGKSVSKVIEREVV